ncbi:hypothetical protein PR048_023326 [Dryococelus australis]|uniref:Uncharacterized protein n=1 Tax=Dryococelus australis TaxID=614101 RepID=A0ABQ9GTS4_9NEOP|nr:hypothetical protein PR048_023326 [Dryococelus australis]
MSSILLIPFPALTTYSLDFGYHISDQSVVASLTNEEKYQWLKNSRVPSSDFKFPMNAEGKKKRPFQRNWLEIKKVSGGLCKMCMLFGRCEGGTNNVKLGKLVVTPLNTYKKAVETLKHHASTDYHKGNMIAKDIEMTETYKQNQKKIWRRVLLKFRIDAGDEILASRIVIPPNEIIQCCGDVITEKIFAKIKNTKYFTIMADETTDISIKE